MEVRYQTLIGSFENPNHLKCETLQNVGQSRGALSEGQELPLSLPWANEKSSTIQVIQNLWDRSLMLLLRPLAIGAQEGGHCMAEENHFLKAVRGGRWRWREWGRRDGRGTRKRKNEKRKGKHQGKVASAATPLSSPFPPSLSSFPFPVSKPISPFPLGCFRFLSHFFLPIAKPLGPILYVKQLASIAWIDSAVKSEQVVKQGSQRCRVWKIQIFLQLSEELDFLLEPQATNATQQPHTKPNKPRRLQPSRD